MLSVTRVVVSAVSSPTVAHIQLAIGVLAVLIAALIAARFWARQRARVPVTGGEPSVLVQEPNTRTRSSRLLIRASLRGPNGGVLSRRSDARSPPVEYLAAIIAILASQAAATAQVSAALMFTLVAFTVAEDVPLISYLAMPAKTVAVVLRLHDWLSARRQPILAVVVGAFGVLLVITGMGNV